MATIYPTLISKIQASLDAVKATGKIKDVFAYPKNDLTKYPSAIFFPNGFDNDFDNTGENLKTYKFTIDIVIGVVEDGIENAYSSIMPGALDAVLAQLDNDWNSGAIDGHQSWSKIETGAWILSQEQSGLELTAEIELIIKVLTNNN